MLEKNIIQITPVFVTEQYNMQDTLNVDTLQSKINKPLYIPEILQYGVLY